MSTRKIAPKREVDHYASPGGASRCCRCGQRISSALASCQRCKEFFQSVAQKTKQAAFGPAI